MEGKSIRGLPLKFRKLGGLIQVENVFDLMENL
jgi:hypothetical protein